jgi:hypothetical protein
VKLRHLLRRPRTTAERRAACAAAADVRGGEDVVPVRARERPTAWDDRPVSARGDRSRRWPGWWPCPRGAGGAR